MTSSVRRLAILLIAMLATGLLPQSLDAHAELRRSSPANGDRLDVAPRELRLWFTEEPQIAFTHIRLLGPDSSDVSLAPARAAGDQSVVTAIRAVLGPGRYTVLWQTGGADGHPSRGRFAFTVQGTAVAGVAPLTDSAAQRDTAATQGHRGHEMAGPAPVMEPVPARGLVAVRWVEFLALLAVVGTLGFRVLLGRSRIPALAETSAIDASLRFGQAALVLLLISALLRFHGQSVALHGAAAWDPATIRSTLLGTSWGRGWLVGVVAVIVTAAGLLLARSRQAGWMVAGLGAASAALAPALTGHAIGLAGSPVIAVAVDWLHVLAAGTWLGTLLVLVLAGIPALRRSGSPVGPDVATLVRSFSPMAIASAGLLGLTGVVSATLRLRALDQLWASDYGRTLLLKLALFAFVLLLGAFNWRRVGPSLGDEASPARIRRSATFELVVAGLVLAVTAALVGTPPPSRPSAAGTSGGTVISGVSR